jgi:hypothetical protein
MRMNRFWNNLPRRQLNIIYASEFGNADCIHSSMSTLVIILDNQESDPELFDIITKDVHVNLFCCLAEV